MIVLPAREELRRPAAVDVVHAGMGGNLDGTHRDPPQSGPMREGRANMGIHGDRVSLEVLQERKTFRVRATFDTAGGRDIVDLGPLFYIETARGCKAYPEVCRKRSPSPDGVLTLEGRGWDEDKLRLDFECTCGEDGVSFMVRWAGMVTKKDAPADIVTTPIARVAARVTSEVPLEMRSLLLLDVPLGEGKSSEEGDQPYRAGVVDGSPVVVPERSLFCGLEHPRAKNVIEEGSRRAAGFILHPISDFGYSAAVGKFDPSRGPSSLFRTFSDYIEMIRASSFHSWLHYNTWYDLRYRPCIDAEVGGRDPYCEYSKKFTEDNVNQRISAIATALEEEGVRLDGVLLDDGWDDWDTLWGVDKKAFPSGDLSKVAKKAQEEHNVKLGVWMSPFGGYQEASRRRVLHGLKMGYEVDLERRTFTLAGKKYSKVFSDQALMFVENDNVVFFKFDGIAGGQFSKGADKYAGEVDSLFKLILDIRRRGKGSIVWINLTIGTWPSPYWLIYGDSIWKDGYDVGLAGWGNRRDMHITERDASVYQNVVQRGLLMPIANLMLHGILQSRANEAGYLLQDSIADIKSFKTEVLTYFFSGVGLQELYIQPEELTKEYWKILADGVRFHGKFQSILRQVQWIGGDPERGQLYGWATSNNSDGVFGMRNPGTFSRKARASLRHMWGISGNSSWRLTSLFDTPQLPPQFATVSLDDEITLSADPLSFVAFHATRVADNGSNNQS
ncbi:hypothetical protein FOZ63_025268 [Perkinsus olseni]|uniref:Alpha-galactosidase n=1 Tax=Perkinsus olseni TaxID=32597 RepID=A0A7J6TDD9_PEROL|nr:hypothetical protein FOZ63_025268 [Perkinsus olseni]